MIKKIFNKLKYGGKLKITIVVSILAIVIALIVGGTQNLQFFRGTITKSIGDYINITATNKTTINNREVYLYEPANPDKGLKIEVTRTWTSRPWRGYVALYVKYAGYYYLVGYSYKDDFTPGTYYFCGFQHVDISRDCNQQRTRSGNTRISPEILKEESYLVVDLYRFENPISSSADLNNSNSHIELAEIPIKANINTQPNIEANIETGTDSIDIEVTTDIPSLCYVEIIAPATQRKPTLRFFKDLEPRGFNFTNADWDDIKRNTSTIHRFNIPKKIPYGNEYHTANLSMICSSIFATTQNAPKRILTTPITQRFFENSGPRVEFLEFNFNNFLGKLEFKTNIKARCAIVNSNYSIPDNKQRLRYHNMVHFPSNIQDFSLRQESINDGHYNINANELRQINLEQNLVNQNLKLMCVHLQDDDQYATDTVVYSQPFQPTTRPQLEGNIIDLGPTLTGTLIGTSISTSERDNSTQSANTLSPEEGEANTLINLIEPRNDHPNTPLNQTFSWQNVPNATEYIFQIRLASSNDFTTFLVPTNSFRSNLLRLRANTEYQWQVCAVIPASDLHCSNTQSFKTRSN